MKKDNTDNNDSCYNKYIIVLNKYM